jgi:hypothetical protein
MNPSARPLSSRNRDRALARLNSITTGTAFAAAIATGGFGALAAATYSGSTDSTGAGAGTGTTTSDTSNSVQDPVAPALTLRAPAATDSPSTVTGLQPTSAPVATVKKKARVTSGGSG